MGICSYQIFTQKARCKLQEKVSGGISIINFPKYDLIFIFIAIFLAILEHIDNSDTEKNGENKFNQNFPLDSGVLDSRCGKGCIPFMEVKKSCIIRFCESYKNTSKSFSFFDRDEIASLTQKKFLIFWVKPNNFFYKILAEAVCFSDRNPRMILEYKNT